MKPHYAAAAIPAIRSWAERLGWSVTVRDDGLFDLREAATGTVLLGRTLTGARDALDYIENQERSRGIKPQGNAG